MLELLGWLAAVLKRIVFGANSDKRAEVEDLRRMRALEKDRLKNNESDKSTDL